MVTLIDGGPEGYQYYSQVNQTNIIMEDKIKTIETLSNLLRKELNFDDTLRNMYGLSLEEEKLIREKLMLLIKQI